MVEPEAIRLDEISSDDPRVKTVVIEEQRSDEAHGQARFRGTRIPVSVVLDCLAAAMSDKEIHEQYPSLPDGSVRAALAYAAVLAQEEP